MGTVHLESMKESKPRRKIQLEKIIPTMREVDHSFLMGQKFLISDQNGRRKKFYWEKNFQITFQVLHLLQPTIQVPEIKKIFSQFFFFFSAYRRPNRSPVRFDRLIGWSKKNLWKPINGYLLGTEMMYEFSEEDSSKTEVYPR